MVVRTMEAVRVMTLGMSTVFLVLALFFVMVKALQSIFPYKEEEK